MKLRDYQLKQLAFHLSADRTINRSAPSTGKTATVCTYMKIKYRNEKKKAVFVMPSSIMLKNKEEVCNWCEYSEDEVAICNGTPAKRLAQYQDKNIKVFEMTFECFSKEWHLLPKDVDVVIIDEFHLGFSTHTSKRTQSYYRSSRRFKYFIMMSGTLIDGRYNSAYPAICVIEPRYYLNYENFMHYHAIYNTWGQVVGWRNPDKIKEILKRHSCSISVEEAYKDRKENIIIYEKCQLDDKHKKAYLQMEKDALLELEDKYIEADSGGVKQIRCRQILSCPEVLDLKVDKIGKDEMLKIHLEDAVAYKKQLLIFAIFEAEQKRIAEVCRQNGLKTEIINGTVSSKRRGEIDVAFRNGEIDVVVGSPATCSIGFNWEHVDQVIFASCDYKDSTFEQAIARGNRGTRKTPLRVYILTYDTKVERRIMQIIKRKSEESKKIS